MAFCCLLGGSGGLGKYRFYTNGPLGLPSTPSAGTRLPYIARSGADGIYVPLIFHVLWG